MTEASVPFSPGSPARKPAGLPPRASHVLSQAGASLTVGVTSAGMNEEAALATALLYRISTSCLPPVWGFFALRWLQRNGYL